MGGKRSKVGEMDELSDAELLNCVVGNQVAALEAARDLRGWVRTPAAEDQVTAALADLDRYRGLGARLTAELRHRLQLQILVTRCSGRIMTGGYGQKSRKSGPRHRTIG